MLLLTHPTRDQLYDYGNGQLDSPEVSEIEQHLVDCESCCRSLGDLPADDFVDQLQAIAQSSDYQNSTKPQVTETGPPSQLLDHPRYRVLRSLGRGGMGDVFLAEHLVLQRMVALKVIRPEHLGHPERMVRFRREMQAVARLSHPNIVAAYDAEPIGDSALLAMEYVEGETLAQYVERVGPRPAEEATALVHQIASALQHAWQRGLVHRDVKPHNVIRTSEGTVKVLDFGLAQLAAHAETDALPDEKGCESSEENARDLTRPGRCLGTPAFMSPEQSRGEPVDIRTDVYGLGAILSYLLLGPEASGKLRDALAVGEAAETAQMLAAVQPRLRPTVRRALASVRDERFATPAEFIQSLPCAAGGGNGSRRTRRSVAAGFGGALAFVFAVIVTISTNEGLVEVRSDDPSVKIRIARGGRTVTILDAQNNEKAVLDPGEYQLRLIRDNQVVETMDLPEQFTLQRGERRVFTIARKRQPAPAEALSLDDSPAAVLGGDAAAEGFAAGLPSSEGTGVQGPIKQLHAWEWPGAHVYCTAFSSAGDRLLGCGDRGLRVWDVKTGELLHELNGHEGYTQWATFSPDDRHLISGGWQDRSIVIWDAQTGEVQRRLTGHTAGVVRIDLSTDGKRILSGSADSTLRIWDFESGELLQTLAGHAATCGGRLSPVGESVLSFSHDGTARLWNAQTGETLKTLSGHQGRLAGCAFGPEPGQAVTWGYDRTVRTWDLTTGEQLHMLTLESDLARYHGAVHVDPACGRILSCHGDPWFRVARLEDGQELARIETPLQMKGFSLTSDCRLASTGSYLGRVYVFDLSAASVERSRDRAMHGPSSPPQLQEPGRQ